MMRVPRCGRSAIRWDFPAEIFRDFGGNDRGCVITAVPEKKR